MLKTITTQTGKPIYQGFDFPKSLENLDVTIVNNTLDYLSFLAEMSDSYAVTRREQRQIAEYRGQHPELKKSHNHVSKNNTCNNDRS